MALIVVSSNVSYSAGISVCKIFLLNQYRETDTEMNKTDKEIQTHVRDKEISNIDKYHGTMVSSAPSRLVPLNICSYFRSNLTLRENFNSS